MLSDATGSTKISFLLANSSAETRAGLILMLYRRKGKLAQAVPGHPQDKLQLFKKHVMTDTMTLGKPATTSVTHWKTYVEDILQVPLGRSAKLVVEKVGKTK